MPISHACNYVDVTICIVLLSSSSGLPLAINPPSPPKTEQELPELQAVHEDPQAFTSIKLPRYQKQLDALKGSSSIEAPSLLKSIHYQQFW